MQLQAPTGKLGRSCRPQQGAHVLVYPLVQQLVKRLQSHRYGRSGLSDETNHLARAVGRGEEEEGWGVGGPPPAQEM
jgi:hypothetical protein